MAGGVLVLAVVSQQDSEPVRLLQLMVQRPPEANLPRARGHSLSLQSQPGSTLSTQPWGGSTIGDGPQQRADRQVEYSMLLCG